MCISLRLCAQNDNYVLLTPVSRHTSHHLWLYYRPIDLVQCSEHSHAGGGPPPPSPPPSLHLPSGAWRGQWINYSAHASLLSSWSHRLAGNSLWSLSLSHLLGAMCQRRYIILYETCSRGRGCSPAGWASDPARCWRRSGSPVVWREIFFPGVNFSVQTLLYWPCTNICVHVENPRHLAGIALFGYSKVHHKLGRPSKTECGCPSGRWTRNCRRCNSSSEKRLYYFPERRNAED